MVVYRRAAAQRVHWRWRCRLGWLLLTCSSLSCQPAPAPPAAREKSATPQAPAAPGAKASVPASPEALISTSDSSANNANTAPNGAEAAAVPPVTAPASGESPPTNRLAQETSPYLQMHAHNPVDWYPWGEEALQKARRENKLIFLSVGYSSCYWCHVMERESFLDQEIAQFLNEHFVCIKVDREERPDIDEIYMMAVQLLTRQGGWPMSVFLTPEGEPFFGGTYFPARDGDRQGAPGFLTIIRRVHQLWNDKSQSIRETSAKVTAALQTELRGTAADASVELNAAIVTETREALAKEFDPQFGGFGFDPFDAQRPKFPEASNLWFLLDQWERQPNESIETMVVTTLDQLYQGGIWDHLGGGFHRYSTDRSWTIPHFEKMLYDNGQLLSIYARAFHLTQRADYRHAVEETFAWLQREMRDDGGGYYSAIDAESEHVEGKYYRWTADELRSVLGADWPLWEATYGLSAAPNFEETFYVLRRPISFETLAVERKVTSDQLLAQLAPGRERLLATRNQRVRPLIDHKILCSWNGLTIRGLADASYYLNDPRYAEAGAKAADFLLSHLRNEQGRLLRTYTGGQARLSAYLDDYAFVIDGLLGLHRATQDARWLEEADRLQQLQLDWFWDTEQAGFFFTASDHERLIVRSRLWMDGAIPAGNSVAAGNLLALSRLLDRPQYRERAEQLLRQAQPTLQASPRLAPRLLTAWSEWLSESGRDK